MRLRIKFGRLGQLGWQGTKRSSPTTPWSSPIVHCDLDAVGSEVEAQLDLATRHVLVRMMDRKGHEDLHGTLHTLGIVDRQARIRSELDCSDICQPQSGGRGLERESDAATHLATLGDSQTSRRMQADILGPGPKCPPAFHIVKTPLARPVAASA